nr:hypothetical protein [Desulfobulbaceae bacterium]
MGKRAIKITLIVILVAGISLLHYFTDRTLYYYHVFYGELYFLPIVLACFWFGLRGGLLTSIGITSCYVPLVYWHWQGFSPNDFDRLLSVVLYNLLATLIGILKDREIVAHERLLQDERLSAMGKSLAAVAHDIKTPLIAIGGFARQLKKKFKSNDPDLQKADIIIQETERLEKMLHTMLDFSRPLELQLYLGNLNELVHNSLLIVAEPARAKGVIVESLLLPDLPQVAFDANRMEQMIVNILLNAVQASPEGGKVTIQTSVEGQNIIIDVTDYGCGIPLHQKSQVFIPFFTTKKKGTGLGLAIVQKIAEAHKGSLVISNNSPCGTIFRIILFRS